MTLSQTGHATTEYRSDS